jgi:hypothetical protein
MGRVFSGGACRKWVCGNVFRYDQQKEMIMTIKTSALYAPPLGAINFRQWMNVPRKRAKMLGAPALWRHKSGAMLGLGQALRYIGTSFNILALIIAMICIANNLFTA